MIPISVSLKNYKSYGNKEVTLELSGEAVRLISGNTGSGKTSFVDAIIWCLYGYSLCKVDEVVNRTTGKNCKVEFNFKSNKDLYSVIRYRKHDDYGNSVVIFKNNKNISPKKNAQDLIEGVIGVGYKAFISAVIFSSEIYISLLRSKGTDRLKIFESILSLAIINKWGEVSRKEFKKVDEKLKEIEAEIDKIDYGVDTIKTSIQDYKNKATKTLIQLKEQKKELEEKKKDYEDEIEEYNNVDIEAELKKNEDYDEAEKKNEEIKSQLSDLKEDVFDIDDSLEELADLKFKVQELDKIRNEVSIPQEIERIQKYEVEKKIFEENIKNLQNLHKEMKKLSEEEKVIQDNINDLENEEQELKKALTEADAGTCPTCRRPFDEHEDGFKEMKKELEEKWQTKTNQVKTEKTKSLRKTEEIKNLQVKVSELGQVVNSFKEQEFQHSVEELKDAEASGDRARKRIVELESSTSKLDESNKKTAIRIKELRSKLVSLKEIPRSEYGSELLREMDTFKKNWSDKVGEIEKQIASVNDKASSVYDKTYVDELNDKIDKLEKAQKKADKKRKEKEYVAKHYEYLTALFSNKKDGIKKFIISKMIKMFNEQVNIYVPLFFSDYQDEISISFNDDLSETILVGGKEVSLDTFSSGEKTRFEIAMTLSLFFLAKIFFASSVKFVVFDELLDKNLDEKSLAKVLSVIKETSRTNSVLIISHRQELKDEFSNHILVSKDKNGMSVIKEIEGEKG